MLAPLSLSLALFLSLSSFASAAPMPYSHSSSYLSTAISPHPQAPDPTGLSNSIPRRIDEVRVVTPRLQARRVVVSRWAEVKMDGDDEEQGERERDVQEVPTGVYVTATPAPTTTNFVRSIVRRRAEAAEERNWEETFLASGAAFRS